MHQSGSNPRDAFGLARASDKIKQTVIPGIPFAGGVAGLSDVIPKAISEKMKIALTQLGQT